MALSARQKTLVQQSFSKVEPIAAQAAEIFYNKLFEIDPSLKPMFKGSLKEQGKKLMTTLKVAVKSLDDLDALVPVLQKLSERHVKYGVKIDDYTPVGNALLHTLKTGLGADFTTEVREAWVEVYKTVAHVMRSHSYADYNPATYKNTKHYNKT